MFPRKGQLVQVRFNNGIFFDAVIEEWTDQKSILTLPDTGETVIIQKTLQDVLLVKIADNINNKQNNYSNKINQYSNEPQKYELQQEFDEIKEQPKNKSNLSRLAELKDELNKLDRKEVLKRATSFEPGGTREVNYGIPRNIKVSGATQYANQEATSPDNEFGEGLQELFNQED